MHLSLMHMGVSQTCEHDDGMMRLQVYPYAKLHCPDGGPDSTVLDGHDYRGHSEWIQAVQDDPSILVPPTFNLAQ